MVKGDKIINFHEFHVYFCFSFQQYRLDNAVNMLKHQFEDTVTEKIVAFKKAVKEKHGDLPEKEFPPKTDQKIIKEKFGLR